MKKIAVLCATVALTAVTQAATINWGMGNVYEPGTTTKVAVGAYTAYLFVTSSTLDTHTITTLSDVQTYLAAGNFSDAVALSSASKANNLAGQWSQDTYLGNFDAGDSVTAFAVILNSTAPETATQYMLAISGTGGVEGGTLTQSFTAATGSKTFAFGSQANNTWHSVPEPTSGLLLLLGMGALALRRKQK